MSPTIYHTFRNFVKGYSFFHHNPIDVRKVIEIYYRKRLFCILDREYKYKLIIEYSNPRSNLTITPMITFGGQVGVAYTRIYEESSLMTLRFKTEKEVKNEINEIKIKQNLISEFDNEQNIKLAEFADKKRNMIEK